MDSPVVPVGNKILILPLTKTEEKSAGGLDLINSTLAEGEVAAVSPIWESVYKAGDVILYPEKKGVSHVFGGKPYLFLDADPNLGEIYAIKSKAK